MFRRFHLAAAALLTLISAASARETWIGQITFTATTGTPCSNDDWDVGEVFSAAFTPSGVSDNGVNSHLGLHYRNRNAYSLRVTSGRFAAGKAYTAVAVASRGDSFSFGGKVNSFMMTPTPAGPISPTTRYIDVAGSVTNWAGNAGCTVSFDGAFVRRR